MCIFSQPVVAVNNTQIFARRTSRQTQLLAYQMNYESRAENAMILPVPVRRPAQAESLRFIDLSDYDDLFDDLANGFPYQPVAYSVGCSGPSDKTSADVLKVFEVGSYIASFVPQLSDFSRLDQRFNLPETTWSQLPQYSEYGFAVFQLAAGAMKVHPMAFEFETQHESIYFPTLHVHDGAIHEKEEFDHVLYMQHAGLDSRVYAYRNSDCYDQATGLIRSKFIARDFCDVQRASGVVDGNLLVHRQILRGSYANRDTIITTSGDPTRPTLNLRPWLAYTPWLVVASAATWFLARRARLKREKSRAEDKCTSKA